MHNDDLTWSPMSGNAFRAATLATVLPIPEDSFPEIGADMYLVNTTALVAPVFNLDSSGGRYRLHDSNWHARTCHTAELSSRTLALSRATHKHLETFARRFDLPLPKSGVGSGSLTLRAHRMITTMASEGSAVTRRLTLLGLAAGGIRTAYQRRDRPLTIRLKYATWFIAMTLVPCKAAKRIVEQLFPPLITDGPNAR